MPEPIVSMRKIEKSFGDNKVLHDVDFDIMAGAVHGLVGHNGAGKSTLIKILAGLYDDYQGHIVIDGREVRLATPAASLTAGIAVIYQEFALVPAFSVAANLALGHEPVRPGGTLDTRAMRRQAAELLDGLGFDLPIDAPISTLSVAHQQLTEIAKALGRNARVLVMDEPTARLPPADRESLFAVIRRLVDRGVGVVFISHFLDEVLQVADEVTVLRDGHVVTSGRAADFTVTQLAREIASPETMARDAAQAEDLSGGQVLDRPADQPPAIELQAFGARGRPSSSLAVMAGEIVGLAGLVGSGRTSLVEAVCGARPHSGTLLINGEARDYKSPADAAASGIILVPEDRKNRGLVMASSVTENITLTALEWLFGRFGFVRSREQRAAAAQSIDLFDISSADGGRTLVRSLSGGNQQKVLIARAAVATPTVMVLDQPTAGVDVGAKSEIYRHIRRLAAKGVACLVVSDELDELLALCDRIAVVRRGQITRTMSSVGLTPAELLEAMSVG